MYLILRNPPLSGLIGDYRMVNQDINQGGESNEQDEQLGENDPLIMRCNPIDNKYWQIYGHEQLLPKDQLQKP